MPQMQAYTAIVTIQVGDLLLMTADPGTTPATRKVTFQQLLDFLEANIELDSVPDDAVNVLMTATERTKLSGIQAGATANSSDAALIARANHTGTQAQSTVVNLVSDLAAKAATTYVDTGDTAAKARANHTGTQLLSTISDAGTAASRNTGTSGASVPLLNAANIWSAQQSFLTTASGGLALKVEGSHTDSGPLVEFYHNSATPTAFDDVIFWSVYGNDSGANKTNIADMFVQFVDPTNGSEDARWGWRTVIAGTLAVRFYIGHGLFAEGVTGGDKGDGSGNFKTLFKQNVAVATEAYVDAAVATVGVVGKQTMFIPASAMTIRSTLGAARGSAESATNKVMQESLDFDPGADEFAQFRVMMPKGWNESTLSYQINWRATATGNVVWGVQAVCISDDDVFDAAFGTAILVTDGVTATTDLMTTAESAAMTPAGTPAEMDTLIIQVYRDADNGSDTCAVDALLLGMRLFYTINAGTDA